MFLERRSKQALTGGAVRPWHVVFIVVVAWLVSEVAAAKIATGWDAANRSNAFFTAADVINALILPAFILIVPEFRRTLPVLFSRPLESPRATDLAWALLTMITWGYGLYRIAFLYPVLYFRPDLFELFALSEAPSKFGWAFIGVAFTAILFAPIAEELMYRGFLLNLWIPRHGLWVGIIASSVVFGVLHWERTLFATVMGVALALIYLRYDSLWPGIVIHGVYNFLCFNWSLGAIVGVKDRATVADPMNWIVEIILTALFLPAAWQFWRRFRPRPS